MTILLICIRGILNLCVTCSQVGSGGWLLKPTLLGAPGQKNRQRYVFDTIIDD